MVLLVLPLLLDSIHRINEGGTSIQSTIDFE
jgi:hypothetical protein